MSRTRLNQAALFNHAESVMRYLAEGDDFSEADFSMFKVIAMNGNADLLGKTISYTKVSDLPPYILATAAQHRHVECIRMLLPLCDVSAARERLEGSKMNEQIAMLDALHHERLLTCKNDSRRHDERTM